jgi:hypothetical protein
MRRHPDDHRLWAICAGGLFLPPFLLLVFVYTVDGLDRQGGPTADWFARELPSAFGLTLAIAFGAALVGWPLHAVIVMKGGWEPPRRSDPQARDYDHKPHPPAA